MLRRVERFGPESENDTDTQVVAMWKGAGVYYWHRDFVSEKKAGDSEGKVGKRSDIEGQYSERPKNPFLVEKFIQLM